MFTAQHAGMNFSVEYFQWLAGTPSVPRGAATDSLLWSGYLSSAPLKTKRRRSWKHHFQILLAVRAKYIFDAFMLYCVCDKPYG